MIPLTKRFVSKSFQQRLVWIRVFFMVIIAAIVIRAIYLQIFEYSRYTSIAEKQGNSSVAVKLRRGPIYDAEGDILAVSLPLQSVFAIPREVENPGATARQLSAILDLPYDEVSRKLNSGISFTWIKRNTKPEISERLKKIDLPGIHFVKEYQRFYPMKNHASQVIGFSGIDSQGLEGIEYRFNKHLMDNTGLSNVWNYFNPKSNLKTLSGGSLQLTIQSKLQYYTEKELRKAVNTSGAQNGVAIIMESQTGKILAMANIPDYDPNNFDNYDSSRFFNRAVNATYEPGSTFKVITIATALDSGSVQKDSIFNCEEGEYQIQDRVIHDVAKYGWLPLQKVLQKSSNICAAKIGSRIPKSIFYKSIRDFGFGSETGIELPGEVSGKVYNYQNWSDTDVATMSFGHTISATPIQVLTAINAIATGGILIKPTIIKSAYKADGSEIFKSNESSRRVLKKETADIVKSFMVSVLKPGGTGVLANISNVSIAGKTGTTRKFDNKNHEYSSTAHISSFIGFFPAQDPQLTILVILDEPQRDYLGTKSAAPVFRKIAEDALRIYPQTIDLPGLKGESVTETIFNNADQDLPDTVRNANVAQILNGLTLRQALEWADKMKLKIQRVEGDGIVRQVQTISSEENSYALILK